MKIHWRPDVANRSPSRIAPPLRAWVLGALALAALGACDAATEPQIEHGENATSSAGGIAGTVQAVDGQPVAGARVSTRDGGVAYTDPQGNFAILGLPAAPRLPVTIEAPGFVSTTKVWEVAAGAVRSRPVRLQPQSVAVTFSAGAGGAVPFGGSGQVAIPANAFAGLAPGDPVTVRATYIDPYDIDELDSAPGDFTARTFSGAAVRLESFGMLDVDARDAAGRRLELAPGLVAALRFPLRGRTPAATRGVWSFDPAAGEWVEEGTAIVGDSAIDALTDRIVPRINIDVPFPPVCVRVRVVRPDGVTPRPNEFVSVTGISYSGFTEGWTDSAGTVALQVPAPAQILVRAGPVAQPALTPSGGSCPVIATLRF